MKSNANARKIVNAGNIIAPAILALEKLGFSVSVQEAVKNRSFVAVRNLETYVADDPVSLLGLTKLIELRSWEWKATDREIENVLQKYHLS